MSFIRIIILLFFINSIATADDKIDEYVENCVDDFFKEVPYAEDDKQTVDDVLLECIDFLRSGEEWFRYYKGKIHTKPRR